MMRGPARLLLGLIVLCAGPGLCGRPLDTDDTGTVSRGQCEMEGGFDFTRAAGGEAWAYTPVLAYGLTDRLQVDFGCDYLVEEDESAGAVFRSLNPSLQFKGRWWSTADGSFTLGVAGNLGWPVRVRGPRDSFERQGDVRLLATRELGGGALDFNAGYEFTGAWGDADDAWFVSAGFRRPVTAVIGWVGEVLMTIPRQGARQSLVATGLTLQGRDGWMFDALVGCGVGRESPDIRLVLGFVRAL